MIQRLRKHQNEAPRFSALLVWLILTCVGSTLLTGCASRTSVKRHEENLTCMVAKIRGKAQYSYDEGKTWKEVKRGDVLRTGCVIRTGSGSSVDILPQTTDRPKVSAPEQIGLSHYVGINPTMFRLFELSVLSIDRRTRRWNNLGFVIVEEVKLDLRLGTLYGSAEKLRMGWEIDVKCPKAVTHVREGRFWMNDKGAVRVLSGMVHVSLSDFDQTIQVGMRQQLDPQTGQVIELPQDRFHEP